MSDESCVYAQRQAKLQQGMKVSQIQGFLINQQVDIFYYTGSMQTGYVFIPDDGEALYFVRRSVERAREESYFIVEPLDSLRTLKERLVYYYPKLWANQHHTDHMISSVSIDQVRIATELDVIPVLTFQRLQKALPDTEWIDGSPLIREQRMIKSIEEITSIRHAAQLIDDALEAAIRHVQVGMAEFELMAYIEYYLRMHGHLGVMRMRSYNSEIHTGIVAAGASAATPTYFDGPAGGRGLHPACPQGSSRALIQQGDPLLVDIGCCIDGYLIDQTRTLVFGELNPILQKAYEVSERILSAAENMLQPGTICEHIYLQAVHHTHEAGLSEHFMGYGQDQVKFLGHGIGLEIDELPILAKGHTYPLQSGMVIAIEPKFTFPHLGVVGIENSYLITNDGYEKLTISREGIISL